MFSIFNYILLIFFDSSMYIYIQCGIIIFVCFNQTVRSTELHIPLFTCNLCIKLLQRRFFSRYQTFFSVRLESHILFFQHSALCRIGIRFMSRDHYHAPLEITEKSFIHIWTLVHIVPVSLMCLPVFIPEPPTVETATAAETETAVAPAILL